MAMNRAESPPMMLPFRAAEKGADERLTYDVPEAGQGLDARRRPGVCDARPLIRKRVCIVKDAAL
jgi:hypothetical protein